MAQSASSVQGVARHADSASLLGTSGHAPDVTPISGASPSISSVGNCTGKVHVKKAYRGKRNSQSLHLWEMNHCERNKGKLSFIRRSWNRFVVLTAEPTADEISLLRAEFRFFYIKLIRLQNKTMVTQVYSLGLIIVNTDMHATSPIPSTA
jgi:hypothetical protein